MVPLTNKNKHLDSACFLHSSPMCQTGTDRQQTTLRATSVALWYCVLACLCVCLSVCPRSNRKTAWTINTKLGTRILYSSCSACVDPEVKRSQVKVTRLRKPSRSHGC